MKPGSPLELPPVSPALWLPWRWAGTTRSNGWACLIHFLIQSTTTVVESRLWGSGGPGPVPARLPHGGREWWELRKRDVPVHSGRVALPHRVLTEHLRQLDLIWSTQ